MSGNKAALKAAKAALDANDFDETIKQAEAVLASDAQNYNARLLLGRAQEKKGSLDSAEATYQAAAISKPDDTQALSGLCSVYTAQGGKNIDAYIDVTTQIAQIFANADDKDRCQSAVNRLTGFVRQHGKPAQIRRALSLTLPESPLYAALEGRVPAPGHTYLRLAESLEAEEKLTINQEITQRRTRIGAKLGQVTTEVKLEVLGRSELEQLYRQVINWTNDDDQRRLYEEKLLEHAHELLTVMPLDSKSEQLDKVLTLAEGAVVVHHPFQLAWDLYLESRDLDNLQDLDVNDLLEYVKYFPNDGLARVIHAWLHSDISPYKLPEKEDDQPIEPLNAEDRLLMITEGISRSERSPFASRLAADFFLSLDEYETATQTARNGIQALALESKKLGMTLQNTKDALNSVLGTALVVHQAPRNHAEAKRLLEEIRDRKPRFTPALIGLGLILEEMEQYQDAIQFLQQALIEDPSNVRIGVELAWCKALHGDHAAAQDELEEYLPQLTEQDPKSRNLRAQCLYRIGICIWQRDSSSSGRKDRNGAYSRFLTAIKTDVEFAPAYTSLGRYYEKYAKDKKRARQCYQKAFELSPAETDAAERLAKSFADQGDWEIVEVVAKRVIDSGRARPPPGSKRPGLSWPYSALGVAQMNKLDYQQAIVSFLAALRINPADYQSYVGLGESYHNSGRYNSASRTFNHALESVAQTVAAEETWFARYMLANVHRELGEYDEAIAGLNNVLKDHPTEFGVLLSLQQTYIEKAWHCVESALFGQAVESANHAIQTASTILGRRPDAFNMWKGLGDACLIFSWVQSGISQFPATKVRELLEHRDSEPYSILSDVDNIHIESYMTPADDVQKDLLPTHSALLAFKRAIQACSSDPHAQAVAWYNLGYAEQRAYTCSSSKAGKAHLKAAVRCFKRAIELEAGNAEFWNALGVVTTMLNPRVAQHSLVRSLHINELNAKVWTNLGVLYMLQGDYELAHQAFGRAQATDPEYAHAWVGEGLIALMTGDTKAALNDFTHAFEISDSWSTITKRQYSMSSFDNLVTSPTASNDLTALIQPLFALEQLHMQVPKDLSFRHLAALFLERVGNHVEAIEELSELCTIAEAEYESSESLTSLARFAHAKADLARNQLAAHDFDKAAENAGTALDLSAEAEESGLNHEERQKLRLSAHMTAGLALNSLSKAPEAINMFRGALDESENNPDVVCVLVKMLWANGGADQKTAARDQLFDCVERFPEHAGCVTLLGAIAALDDDGDTMAAVRDDLLSLRVNDRIELDAKNDIQRLLSAFAGLSDSSSAKSTATTEAQAAILLDPSDHLAWKQLSNLCDEVYPAIMALNCAQKAVPPNGSLTSEDLGKAFSQAGTARDDQRAMALAPWAVSVI